MRPRVRGELVRSLGLFGEVLVWALDSRVLWFSSKLMRGVLVVEEAPTLYVDVLRSGGSGGTLEKVKRGSDAPGSWNITLEE